MSPHDFLEVAGKWAIANREAEWHSAASRAYYAAFHAARQLFLQWGFAVPQSDKAHAYLWLRLANAGHVDIERGGDDLNNMRGIRNEADYDLKRPFDQQVALDMVHLATDVVYLLESVVTVPSVQAQVVDTIKIYERDVLRHVTWQQP